MYRSVRVSATLSATSEVVESYEVVDWYERECNDDYLVIYRGGLPGSAFSSAITFAFVATFEGAGACGIMVVRAHVRKRERERMQ